MAQRERGLAARPVQPGGPDDGAKLGDFGEPPFFLDHSLPFDPPEAGSIARDAFRPDAPRHPKHTRHPRSLGIRRLPHRW